MNNKPNLFSAYYSFCAKINLNIAKFKFLKIFKIHLFLFFLLYIKIKKYLKKK